MRTSGISAIGNAAIPPVVTSDSYFSAAYLRRAHEGGVGRMKKRVFYHLSQRIFSSLNLSITAPPPFGTPIGMTLRGIMF